MRDRWRKLGRVYCPDNHADWSVSHAANPFPEPLGGNLVRVYFSTRDSEQRSSISTCVMELGDPPRLLEVAERPVLGPGDVGLFDDSGASMGCLTQVGDRTFLYYLGWNLGRTVPWRNAVGLAIREPGSERFERWSLAPVLDRNPIDPYSVSYPFVLSTEDGYRMWYGSNRSWGADQASMDHILKDATSPDGITWSPTGTVVVDAETRSEYAFSRPCVVRDGDVWRMWYSFRGDAYRIGLAESTDGLHWKRRDDTAGIAPSADGWDSVQVSYAMVFDAAGERWMVYNGTRYGLTGFGLAIWEGTI